MRGMMVGRFQPFHNGHLNAVKYILKEVDEVIIVIAASQQSHEFENPFAAGERYEMIYNSIIEELKDISRVKIIPANDVKDNGLWVAHVLRLIPKFDLVYTNNPLTKLLFEQAGKEVRTPPLYERKDLSAENIRKLMREGNNQWKKLVPKAVGEFIEKINGLKRLEIITTSDK